MDDMIPVKLRLLLMCQLGKNRIKLMSNLKLCSSREVGVRAFSIKGHEGRGLAYSVTTMPENAPVGGQCACCNTVIWTNSRENSILNAPIPLETRNGGEIYKEYYRNNLKFFLNSLPSCPKCLNKRYDLFINNIVVSRFENGDQYVFDPSISADNYIYCYPDVWWYEEGQV